MQPMNEGISEFDSPSVQVVPRLTNFLSLAAAAVAQSVKRPELRSFKRGATELT